MKTIYMIAADVLRALGWEVEINEKNSYWNLVLTNTSSTEAMPESHKSCLRGLLRGWLMEFELRPWPCSGIYLCPCQTGGTVQLLGLQIMEE